jgi:hypothetical protein
MTSADSSPALAACSSSTPATHTRSSSSSTGKSRLSMECRLRACSSTNFASRNFSSFFNKERKIWCSSNTRLKLECLDLEVRHVT